MTFAVVILFIGFVSAYFAYKALNKRNWAGGIVLALVALFFITGGITSAGQESSSNSSSSSQSSSASSKTSSQKEASSLKKARAKMKSDGIKQLNDKIAQQPELAGLKVKQDKDVGDDDYTVTVPDEVTGYSDNEQKETYRHLVKLVKQYTGDNNPTVMFVDQSGNSIAETTWTGDIKLD